MLLFIGDSLTEWFNFSRHLPGEQVINEGIAGDTTYGLLERLDGIMDVPAAKIFLMIGINDVFNGFLKEDIVENLELIIEQLQTHINGTELIVQSLLPVNEHLLGYAAGLNNTVRFINEELKEHCRLRKLTFLDLFPLFLSGDEMDPVYTTDGGHLSEAGYRVWAKKIQATL